MSAKAYLLEDRIQGTGYYLKKGPTISVGRNPNCNFSTLNPKTLDSKYTDTQRTIAGHVSGIHFYISHETDGNVYIWDNSSTNGLYIKSPNDEIPVRIHEKTMIAPGTTIYASKSYEFFLREKIDIDAQKRAEEKASTDTTEILKSEELFDKPQY